MSIFAIGLMYPRVKLNTTYSFGIDDQEFVVAFETNFPEDFLDLVQQLRETEISLYTLEGYADLQLRAGSGGGDAGSAGIKRMAKTTVVRTGTLAKQPLGVKSKAVVGAKARAIAKTEPVSAKKKAGKTRNPLDPERIAAILDGLRKTYPGCGLRAEPQERVGADGCDDSFGAVYGCSGESGDARIVQGVSDAEGDGCGFPSRA